MKFKKKTGVDACYRSLLQKAVRRGHIEHIYTVSALLKSLGLKERNWFTSCAAIITFEECWPLGAHLKFNKKFHSGENVPAKAEFEAKKMEIRKSGCALYNADLARAAKHVKSSIGTLSICDIDVRFKICVLDYLNVFTGDGLC